MLFSTLTMPSLLVPLWHSAEQMIQQDIQYRLENRCTIPNKISP